MKMIRESLLSLFLLFGFFYISSAQDFTSYEFETNKEVHSEFIKLYTAGNYEEAAKVLNSNYKRFDENLEANTFNLAATLGKLNRLNEAVEVLNYGLDNGTWYNILALQSQIFAPFHDLDDFKEIVKRNQSVCDSVQVAQKADYLIIVPDSFNKRKNYPLFVGLHGAGGNCEDFSKAWTSDLIKKDFISLYIQSSQIVARNGYTWSNNMQVSVSEIDSIVKLVCGKYPINKKAIILSGFSSGGNAAMEVTLQNRLPVKGFIALCPDKPESWNEENILEAITREVEGVLLTTELDPRIEQQKQMAEELKRLGLRSNFVVTPNTGHWIPEDLPEQLDKALDQILK